MRFLRCINAPLSVHQNKQLYKTSIVKTALGTQNTKNVNNQQTKPQYQHTNFS